MLGLPKDPMMLFSVINAHLRDTYPSLDALCDDLHVEKQQIIDQLAAVGYVQRYSGAVVQSNEEAGA